MSTKATKLKARAADAADVRSYDTDPDVVAYRLERRATLGTGLIWAGIVLGLAFTVPNVQAFVAGDAEPWSIVWTTAWLLDVMVSLPLIGVLVLEQATTKQGIPLGPWARVLKWGSLSATYAMNTWHSWSALDAPGILVHSVPPLVVFVCAEVLPDGRDRITRSVRKAAADVRPNEDETSNEGASSEPAGSDEAPARPVSTEVAATVDTAPAPAPEEVADEAPRSTADQREERRPTEPVKVRADKGTRVPAAAKPASKSVRQMSVDELAARLEELVSDEASPLTNDSSVNEISAELGCSWKRAKAARDLRSGAATEVVLPGQLSAVEALADDEEVAA